MPGVYANAIVFACFGKHFVVCLHGLLQHMRGMQLISEGNQPAKALPVRLQILSSPPLSDNPRCPRTCASRRSALEAASLQSASAWQGFTRSEQECKLAVDGVGWLTLASSLVHCCPDLVSQCMSHPVNESFERFGIEAKILSPNDTVRDLPAALVEAGCSHTDIVVRSECMLRLSLPANG